jgi:hypothetical protein
MNDLTLLEWARRRRLTELLDTMDIPAMRRDLTKESNIRWLQRNITIDNNKHPRIMEATALLKREALRIRKQARAQNENI